MTKKEILKKQIIYRSTHRGSKEMDILLGNFINKYIDLFNENELNLFDSILECDDEDIYQWILGKKEIPENYSNRTLQLLINTTQNLK